MYFNDDNDITILKTDPVTCDTSYPKNLEASVVMIDGELYDSLSHVKQEFMPFNFFGQNDCFVKKDNFPSIFTKETSMHTTSFSNSCSLKSDIKTDSMTHGTNEKYIKKSIKCRGVLVRETSDDITADYHYDSKKRLVARVLYCNNIKIREEMYKYFVSGVGATFEDSVSPFVCKVICFDRDGKQTKTYVYGEGSLKIELIYVHNPAILDERILEQLPRLDTQKEIIFRFSTDNLIFRRSLNNHILCQYDYQDGSSVEALLRVVKEKKRPTCGLYDDSYRVSKMTDSVIDTLNDPLNQLIKGIPSEMQQVKHNCIIC